MTPVKGGIRVDGYQIRSLTEVRERTAAERLLSWRAGRVDLNLFSRQDDVRHCATGHQFPPGDAVCAREALCSGGASRAGRALRAGSSARTGRSAGATRKLSGLEILLQQRVIDDLCGADAVGWKPCRNSGVRGS